MGRAIKLKNKKRAFKAYEDVDMENKNQLESLKNDNALDLLQTQKQLIMKKAGSSSRLALGQLFENCIDLEESAVLFGLAPYTVHKGAGFGKTSLIKMERKQFLRSKQEWFNHKEEPLWQ